MPNGRSGGFPIETVELERLAQEASGKESVGTQLSQDRSGRPGEHDISGAEFVSLVEKCRELRVAIEEQGHSSYLIHLSNDPVVWVLVDPASPIFAGLRQRHRAWETEHPDSNGWIGF